MDKRWMKRCLAACATAMLACGGAGAQDWNADTEITVATNVDVANINGCRVSAADFLTAGTLNVNNGNLEVNSPADSANFGAINITLGDNNKADGDGSYVFRCAIFWGAPVPTAGTAAMIAGKLKLSGGKIGESYGVFENFTEGEDPAVSAAIKNAGSIYSYDVSYAEYDIAYIATVTGIKDDPDDPNNAIVSAATKDSTANAGIATVITDLAMRYEQLSPELQQVMDALNNQGANLGRAITELNGANAAVAGVKVSTNAAQQFNAALGNVFADRQMARRAAGRESASAGGLPVTYANVGNAADCERRYSGWLKAYGGFGGVDATAAAAGYSFGGVGAMAGIERQFGAELSLGALVGWSFNRSALDHDLGDATDNILRLGLYGDYYWEGFQFATSPSFGIHMMENERRVNFLGYTAKSDRTGFDFNWYNKIGYTYEFCNGLMLTPSYALGMTYMHDPAHSEHGAPGANLQIRDYDHWSLLQNLELKVGKVFQVNDRVAILPEIWGGWEHEYLSSNDVSMAFAAAANNSWNAPVSDIAADRAVFGAGVKTMVGDRWQIDARYDQKIWDGGYSTNFALGATLKF